MKFPRLRCRPKLSYDQTHSNAHSCVPRPKLQGLHRRLSGHFGPENPIRGHFGPKNLIRGHFGLEILITDQFGSGHLGGAIPSTEVLKTKNRT